MAAITFTSDNVALSVGDPGTTGRDVCAEEVYQGDAVTLVDGEIVKATRSSTAAVAHVVGIMLSLGSQNQQAVYAISGVVDFGVGATLVTGRAYFLGTDGQIIPEGDLVTGNYVTFLGIAQSTRLLLLEILPSGVVRS